MRTPSVCRRPSPQTHRSTPQSRRSTTVVRRSRPVLSAQVAHAIFDAPSDNWMVGSLAPPTIPCTCERVSAACGYGAAVGEREGCRDVVVGGSGAVRCGWHPDLRHWPVSPAGVLPQSSDPPIPMLSGVVHRVRRPPTSARAVSGEPRVVVGAVRVLAEGDGSVEPTRPSSLWINSLGWTTASPDSVGDHRSPAGDLARRLGGRAGEAEVSAHGRSGRRAERGRVGRPARRTAASIHEHAHHARTQASRAAGPSVPGSLRSGGSLRSVRVPAVLGHPAVLPVPEGLAFRQALACAARATARA